MVDLSRERVLGYFHGIMIPAISYCRIVLC
jgi:hypothetical protein